jgi:hypothetical protein
MWGPVLGWCVLQWLAESIDITQPERTALDLFDRLRLRGPFGHAFTALGFQGEEPWRVAARIKVLLLTSTGTGKEKAFALGSRGANSVAPDSSSESGSETREGKTASPSSQPDQVQPALAPVLWFDPDVRWLCGVHESDGHLYVVREQYEELLWWLLMPALLRMAGEAAPSRAAVEELSKTVATALHSAEAAGYRIETLLGPLAAVETGATSKSSAPEPEPDDPDVSAE